MKSLSSSSVLLFHPIVFAAVVAVAVGIILYHQIYKILTQYLHRFFHMSVAIQEANVEEKTKLINTPGNIFYLIRTKDEHKVNFRICYISTLENVILI